MSDDTKNALAELSAAAKKAGEDLMVSADDAHRAMVDLSDVGLSPVRLMQAIRQNARRPTKKGKPRRYRG